MCSWTVMRLISGTLRSTPLPWLPVLSNIETPALQRKAATDKLVEKIIKHDSWPIQADILNPPLLRLTFRKPLWLDLQPVDIKSRWTHNWKSAQVVNSHLECATPQSGNRVSTSLGNDGLCWTVFTQNRDTAVPAEENGDLQTLICVLVARPIRSTTLSNPVPWQNWMAAYLGYTLWMKMLFRGWPVIVHDTHTRRRSSSMSHSRQRPLHHSSSMVTTGGVPLDFHWWTARVPSNLVYRSSAGSTSRDQEDNQSTNRCACRAPCVQEHHSQAGQCVQCVSR